VSELVVRAGSLYVPILAAMAAGLLRRPGRRLLAGCLLSFLWAMASLVILQYLNAEFGWWSFSVTNDVWFCGMPLELYFGWAALWGVAPQLLFRRMPLLGVAAVMACFDLAVMPRCVPVVRLGPAWLLGEGAAIVLVLLPAIAIARWTAEDTHLNLRAAAQVAISGMLFLLLLPQVVFTLRPGRGWVPLLAMPSPLRQLMLQAVCLLAVPGISAVMEFAQRGGGTPIPFDPPRRLVTSGVYRYIANPMQASCAVVMLAWALALRSGWFALAAGVTVIYSVGLAAWDESADLAERYGKEWQAYRAQVKDWRVRWRPYHAGAPARLYIARTCGPCSELRRWIEARHPLGLELVHAETLAPGSIQRMRYDPADGTECVEGVRALARVLEHLNAGWAYCGALLRLPGVWQLVQLVMDASGLGPRELERAA